MDIFWRKEEKRNGRKKRRGNSDNARFHISPEKMNEPSHSLTHSLTSSAAAGAATGNTSQDGFSVGLIVELN